VTIEKLILAYGAFSFGAGFFLAWIINNPPWRQP